LILIQSLFYNDECNISKTHAIGPALLQLQ
jgi:hypothetical protein